MSLQDDLKKAESNEMANSQGGWYKVKEGPNTLRILSLPIAIFEDFKRGTCYTGCGFKGTIKHLTYVLDRTDNAVKLYKMPHTIFKWLVSLEANPDWAFDGFPMPYDIVIGATNAGVKEVDYVCNARPVKEAVSPETLALLAKKTKAEVVLEKLQAKSKEKNAGVSTSAQEDGGDIIDPADIPY
jgi:hypothetical protein